MTNLNSLYKITFIILLICFSIASFSQTFTEQTGIPITGISIYSEVWGDYDNDGNIDVLLMGYSNYNYITKIYHNNGDNTFTEQSDFTLEGVYGGSAAWGDYDNDGYLDILLTGQLNRSSSLVSKIYHNDGGTKFTEQSKISLIGVSGGSVAWGDYDNDGYQDILLTGYIKNDYTSKIYRNDKNNNFSEQTQISLTGVYSSSVAWGDYDNDGDLDILLTGDSGNGGCISKIYQNNGDNSFAEQLSLTGVEDGAIALGDYDNDGYLDILLTGKNGSSYSSPIVSKIYHNNGNNSFTEQTQISLTGVYSSSVAWGDYDNDGDLDILISGSANSDGTLFVSKIYRNNEDNTFTEQLDISLPKGKIAWTDFDNDGDLDILVFGAEISKIYRNNATVKNQPPNAPTGIGQTVSGRDVILKWMPVMTDATPSKALSYNVRIGTSSAAINTLSPQASDIGFRRVATMGNGQLDTVFSLKNLKKSTYYWSVQAIDNSYIGGSFSTEGIFNITSNEPAYGLTVSKFEGSYAEVKWNRGSLAKCIVFIKEGTGNFAPTNNTTYTASSIFGIGTSTGDGWYCVYSGIGDYVKITGLKGFTNYSVQVFEYDGLEGQENYLTTDLTDNMKSFTTLAFTQQPSLSLKNTYLGSPIENIDLGDYDKDGYLDILMTYCQYGGSSPDMGITKIFRNNGDTTYTEQTQVSLRGIYNGSAKWWDYNNDGFLDIIESGRVSGSKSWAPAKDTTLIYKNNGNGTFTVQNNKFPALVGSFIALGDYDNDGYLDIILTGSGVSKIYRNNGDNTFSEQTEIRLAGISYGSAAWGDYNNDGYLDIVLTGSGVSKIYQNNGNNTFTEQTEISLSGVSGSSVVWGDYDNDGYSDLLLTGQDNNNLFISKIYRNNANNSFTEQSGISLAGVNSGYAIWGDYNNDEYLDILLSGKNGTANISKIYRNNGDNTFIELMGNSLTGVAGKCTAWADFDNDKDLDIFLQETIYTNDIKVANSIPNNAPIDLNHIVTSNNVKLMWKHASQSDQGRSYNLNVFNMTKSIDAFPSNSAENGFRKIVSIGNAQLNTSYTLKDLKNGTYYWQVQSVDNNYQGGAFSVIDSFVVDVKVQSSVLTISDIDGYSASIKWKRGNLDKCAVFIKEGIGNLNLTNSTTYTASNIYKKGFATSDGWFCVYNGTGESVQVSGLIGLTNYTAIVIEFDGIVGNEQYLSTLTSDNSVSFKTNNFTIQTDVSLESVIFSCSAWGDYDNDGDLDILITGRCENTTSISKIYKNNGDNTFTEQTGISLTGVEGGSVAWGDYNNDGYLDILLAGYSINGPVSKFYRNNGDNTFTEQTGISLAGIYNGSALWGDYDIDGYLDILLVGNRISKIYHNNGDGSFSESDISLQGVENGSAAWGDYDNDGYLDILITGNTMSSLIAKIYRNNGGKTFTVQNGIALTGAYYSSVAWGDYNNDGYLDIIIAGNPNYGTQSTKLYKNNGDNTFTEQTGIVLIGVESGSIAWGDYDNDGDLDILTNGTNNGYNCSKIYRNNGDNTFSDQADIKLKASSYKTIVWGDYDNDGDQDILVGNQIYRNYITSNQVQKPNMKALSPKGLTSHKSGNEYLLSWSGDNTDETPVNTMSYNVAIAKNKNLLSLGTLESAKTNFKLVGFGNTGINNFYKVKLESGKYYWQVQAIDGGFQGGEWSDIDSTWINNDFQIESEVYPNPVQTVLTITNKELTDTCQLYIYSIDGSILYNMTLENEKTYIDLSSYKNGIYILKISNSEKVISKKIIKM